MRSINFSSVLPLGLFIWTAVAFANPAEHAGLAAKAGVQASGNASASAGHSLAATGQLASGIIATPILTSGLIALGAGSVAVQAGGALVDATSQSLGRPLPVTDETISILPPNKALQIQNTPTN